MSIQVVETPITPSFHEAFILSIVKVSKEHGIGIFEFIQFAISETNWKLSPGDINLSKYYPAYYVKRYLDGKFSYPLMVSLGDGRKDKEKRVMVYKDFIIKIDEYMREERTGGWDKITWFDFLTYLLFIQSNCHHKGNVNSSKLCRNSDSFLNFFYKSKSSFNPMAQWERDGDKPLLPVINESKKEVYRAEWWVEAFKRDKDNLLMYHDLGDNREYRKTIGWTVRGFKGSKGLPADRIPSGAVLNQLRSFYNLPKLSGEYSLGIMSSNTLHTLEIGDEKKEEKKSTYGICEIGTATICILFIGRWMIKNVKN
tara:strand:- start:269 stop:1204 length:936 start_codon:yes stop_codon:yes gene_type:complete